VNDGPPTPASAPIPAIGQRLLYLDWLRGIAVVAMVLSHVTESWTRPADRLGEPFYTLTFVAGVASPLFLFLAGVASALSAASKARREGSHRAGAAFARRRGWEIFALGLAFRVQSQLLGLGPIDNIFKVDMLNTMGLSMVAASYVWQWASDRRWRAASLAFVTGAITMVTPLVRDVAWLAPLPDPIEAYLRPAANYGAFPLFPWAGFLFAGALVGALVDAVRDSPRHLPLLQNGIAIAAGGGAIVAWFASFQPSIYPSSSFWHDSPTFFFIRLGLVALLVPAAWVIEQMCPVAVLRPLVTLGRSSLFVYWIHVEMVYGVIAEPIKQQLPLWATVAATGALTVLLYGIVLLKNRLLERYQLTGPWRVLAPVIR
jgi:uncharacterized membrane protein